ncbi:orphan sodium- and chloride-dependent neurotransmitter transporter NTT5 [Kogia breviceps]|uniref:orphan sodium- and chloride-dependent neurotransmitter transporter NTT5 n=1 Tax=Kogia breviceps TaxID=27615 RepID=UPI0034D1A48E
MSLPTAICPNPLQPLRGCLSLRSVSKLMKLTDKGVLPQDAKPPKDIPLLPALDYLEWINSLPRYLRHQVIHLSPSCSLKAQKEKGLKRLIIQEGAKKRRSLSGNTPIR